MATAARLRCVWPDTSKRLRASRRSTALLPTTSASHFIRNAAPLSQLHWRRGYAATNWFQPWQADLDRARHAESRQEPPIPGPPPPPPPYDIVFCGSDAFAARVLQGLIFEKQLWKSISVITIASSKAAWDTTTRARGGPRSGAAVGATPVSELAREHGLRLRELGYHDEMNAHVLLGRQRLYPSHLLITASFDKLVPAPFLRLFSRHSTSLTINVHPSHLPKLRGAAPIQRAIAEGLPVTATSIQTLSEGRFDRGALLAVYPVSIPWTATTQSLTPLLAEASAKLLTRTLVRLPEAHRLAIRQDESQASLAPKISDDDMVINWRSSAGKIYDQWRAFGYHGPLVTHLHPAPNVGSRSLLAVRDPVLKVMLSGISRVTSPEKKDASDPLVKLSHPSIPPGAAMLLDSGRLVFKTASADSFVTAGTVQTPNRDPLPASEFYAGYPTRRRPLLPTMQTDNDGLLTTTSNAKACLLHFGPAPSPEFAQLHHLLALQQKALSTALNSLDINALREIVSMGPVPGLLTKPVPTVEAQREDEKVHRAKLRRQLSLEVQDRLVQVQKVLEVAEAEAAVAAEGGAEGEGASQLSSSSNHNPVEAERLRRTAQKVSALSSRVQRLKDFHSQVVRLRPDLSSERSSVIIEERLRALADKKRPSTSKRG